MIDLVLPVHAFLILAVLALKPLVVCGNDFTGAYVLWGGKPAFVTSHRPNDP